MMFDLIESAMGLGVFQILPSEMKTQFQPLGLPALAMPHAMDLSLATPITRPRFTLINFSPAWLMPQGQCGIGATESK